MWYVIYLKISVSKHSHVICLLIGFWGRCTHFRLLFGYLTAVGRHSTTGGRLGPPNHIWDRGHKDDFLDKNTCQIICRRGAIGFPTRIFRDIDLISSLIIHNSQVSTNFRTRVRYFSNGRPPEAKCGLHKVFWTYTHVIRHFGFFGAPLWFLNMKWPLSHIWFGGLILCYDGLQWSNSQIDARNEFSEPKNLWKDISHGYILKLIFSDSFCSFSRP